MSRLTWTERKYSSGVDRGVVYSQSGSVEAWNGLIAVTEKPSDIRERVRYRDGVKTVNHRAEDSFAATVECFTYPELVSHPRSPFNMAYRTRSIAGYEIHLIYNAFARVSGKTYSQNEATPLSFEISTRPRAMPLLRAPSAHLIIDTSLAYPPAVTAFEDILYGDADTNPRFPFPDELITLFDANALFRVVDNGDGTATLHAPDEVFDWINANQARADWPYVNQITADIVRLRNF